MLIRNEGLHSASWDCAQLTAWLEQHLRPQSSIGRRYAVEYRFGPGQEQEARQAMKSAITGAALWSDSWDDIGEIFQRLFDPSEAYARLCSGVGDLLDLERLLRFLEGVRSIGPLVGDAGVLPQLEGADERALERIYDLLAPGRTRDGFVLRRAVGGERDRLEAAYLAALAQSEAASQMAVEELAALGVLAPLKGPFILSRAEYLALPGAALQRLRVVQDAATSVICEPAMTAAMADAKTQSEQILQAFQAAEQAELEHLGREVAQEKGAVERALGWIAALDASLQRLRFVRGYQGCLPEMPSTAGVELEEGRLLPLEQALGAGYTPVSFAVHSVAVIVGSNMGGKSAALATAALALLLAQRGLPPAARKAKIGLFDEILEVRTAGRPAPGLSDFGQEIRYMQRLLMPTARRRCILIDEFARSTNVNEGRALLIAVLRMLRQRNVVVFAATHFAGVAAALDIPQYRIRGLRQNIGQPGHEGFAEVLAQLSAAFDRTLICELAGSVVPADALTVAAALGLDDAVIADARRVLEEDGA